ncbi:MAG: hypothetical protein ACE5PM_08180 [Candidatus Hydrothermarchaeales archaeon]
MPEDIAEKGEEVYRQKEEELERKFFGKVVAINVEKGEISGKGDSIVAAAKEAMKKYPGKLFYFKRVGYPYTEHFLVIY